MVGDDTDVVVGATRFLTAPKVQVLGPPRRDRWECGIDEHLDDVALTYRPLDHARQSHATIGHSSLKRHVPIVYPGWCPMSSSAIRLLSRRSRSSGKWNHAQ